MWCMCERFGFQGGVGILQKVANDEDVTIRGLVFSHGKALGGKG